MDEMSVTQFAGELKMPANVLLEQLQKAGVSKSGVEDLLTEQDKARLLEYLRRSHGEMQPKGKITLTRKQTSEIRATDSSGRARTVQVEVRKKRVFVKRDEVAAEAPPKPAVEAVEPPPAPAAVAEDVAAVEKPVAPVEPVESTPEPVTEASAPVDAPAPTPEPVVEEDVAAKREAAAAAAPAEKEKKSDGDAKPVRKRTRVPAQAYLSADEIASRAAEDKRMQQLRERQEADLRAKQERELAAKAAAVAAAVAAEQPAEEEPQRGKGPTGTLHRPAKADAGRDARRGARPPADDAPKSRRGMKTRGEIGGGGGNWKGARGGGRSRGGNANRDQSNFQAPTEPIVREVHVPETITVADLAHKMAVKAAEVIKALMKMGSMVTINQVLDQETAMIIVEEMGHKAVAAKLDDPDAFLESTEEDHGNCCTN